MAIEKLPVNFKDDVIDTSVSDKRRYNIIENEDGTKSLEDVTTYSQIGSNFGAEQVNQTNGAVNSLINGFSEVENSVKEVKGKDFILANQSVLTFINRIASMADERITADSLADVYFTSDTTLAAEKAVITVETYSGRVDLTAEREPEGEIKASIVIRVV